MGIFSKIADVATGKTPEQREEERKFYREAKMEVNKEYMTAKKKEAIEFAKKKAQLEYQMKLKRMKQSYNRSAIPGQIISNTRDKYHAAPVVNPFGGYGVSTIMQPRQRPAIRIKRRKRKHAKRINYAPMQQQRYNPIWG